MVAGWLGEYARANRLAVHGWTLTPTQLLLLTSAPDSRAVSRTIQAIGRRLAAVLKTGNVFEGRYKSALIAPDWVLSVQIWLESVPVTEGYAAHAPVWPWSSAGYHVGDSHTAKAWSVALSDHESYWACGNTPFDRQAFYRDKLTEGVATIDCERIRSAITGQWALGSAHYVAQMGKVASRRVAPSKRGRPPKQTVN